MNATSQSAAESRAPLSAYSAALVAATVGFGSTIALIVQAHVAMGGTAQQVGSAVTALCVGIGLFGILLSRTLRLPVILGWSTPGAALMVASVAPGNYPSAVGAFVASGFLMMAVGSSPLLGRIAMRIPVSVASGMLAGVILPFCLSLFRSLQSDLLLVALVLFGYVAARQRLPRHALMLTVALVVGAALWSGQVADAPGASTLGGLVATAPDFDLATAINLGLPLFLVTLASQNMPGLMVLKSAGFSVPSRLMLWTTGLATSLLAPLGAHGINLAAMTAALCTGEDACPNRDARWIVGLAFGGAYLLLAAFSGPLVGVFLAFPTTTISVITGIAMIAPLIQSLNSMLSVPDENEAAVLTFLTTASGISLFNVGSAFWGLTVGFIALGIRRTLGGR